MSEQASPHSLKSRFLQSSVIELAGFGISQAIRLASNIVLSRLLFPEAFGLSALVNIFNQGLIMISDVGIGAAMMQSKEGDNVRWINTAWTLQLIRGALLWLLVLACAWPYAWFYDSPLLRWLLPFGGLAVLLGGLRSTKVFSLRRELRIAPLAILEIGSQLFGAIVMILWAWHSPSAWTLVGGAVAAAAASASASHLLTNKYQNRVLWDPEHGKQILTFGRWVAGTSMLTFAAQQADRLYFGQQFSAAQLGIYSVAVFLSGALGDAVNRLTNGVVLPVFSRVHREAPDTLPNAYYRTRFGIEMLTLPALGGLCALGQVVVELLYDDRYHDAGWALQVLCVRVGLATMVGPALCVMLARGTPRAGFHVNLARVLWLIVALPLGSKLYGLQGFVWATACSEIPALALVWYTLAQEKILRPSREAISFGLFALGLGLGYLVHIGALQIGLIAH